jgi:hypothetical protein
LISIVKDFPTKYIKCNNLCITPKTYVYLKISYINYTNNENIEIFDSYDFFDDLYFDYLLGRNKYIEILRNLDYNLELLFVKNKLCLPKYKNGTFNNCYKIIYDAITNTYKCAECINKSFIIDPETNSCILINNNDNQDYYLDKYNCLLENIGNSSYPIYSCRECYNNSHLLVRNEDNIKYCKLKNDPNIKFCTEANSNTYYINTLYNCTKCSYNFLPYYSEFFDRKICQNIFEEIITEKKYLWNYMKELNMLKQQEKEFVKNFTPDGKKCYKCDNEDVGMIGCEGACNYSIKRNDILKCENKCKKGYIEIREGICEPCEIYNKGCYECHYENKYPKNYIKLKRKRRFVCDYCEEGFIQKEDKCISCDDLDLNDCEKCEIDQINNDKYICTKCNEYSILLENNTCLRCDDNNKFQNNNKCYYCNDTDNNGIKGCSKCEKNKNKIICQLCDFGYI